jgi:magnesium transporter
MSEQDDVVPSSGSYQTPVPELDDHRHRHNSSGQHTDRPRRGTFDSVHRRQQAQDVQTGDAHNRGYDEEVIDDDAASGSPTAHRSRRPTVVTLDPRSVSPPNSVKAFAEARRRERALSMSDHANERGEKEDCDEHLHRAVSVASHRSRPLTVDDGASVATNKSAEEDVCFPPHDEQDDDELHIDFEYLENFMRAQEDLRSASLDNVAPRIFPDLRPHATGQPTTADMVSSEGDFVINIPSHHTSGLDEKQTIPVEESAKNTAPTDPNRFSFFSSTWESTIHAADFQDLVLPGEDIRTLFTSSSDGVWWLNVSNPTEEEIRGISRAFNIHPLTREDITTQESREKIELFPSYYFASFRSFNIVMEDDEVEYEPFHLYVVVFREGTISFSFAPNAHASNVRKRISMLRDYVALSSDWICYALMYDRRVDNSYLPG